MGLFSRSQPTTGIRDLGWDLHAHLIPGVDDGVRDIADALAAIKGLQALGYRGCVVTPHVYKDLYNNTRATLEAAFNELVAAVRAEGIDFAFQLAAEYFGDEHFLRLAETEKLLAFGDALVLVEFPYMSEPMLWADVLSAITRAGYQPIIAHPERYRYFVAEPREWLKRFGDFPVQYQCDLGSLTGQHGRDAARMSRWFLSENRACFWGSDLHRSSQVDRFIRPAISELQRCGYLRSRDVVNSAVSRPT